MTSMAAAIGDLRDAGDASATLTFPIEIGRMLWNPRIPGDIERLGGSAGLESVVATARGGSIVTNVVTVTARGAASDMLGFLRSLARHYGI